jgi:hypothetical protein
MADTGPSSNRVDIFNATSGEWTTASLSVGRYVLAAASVKDLVLFGGGYDGGSVLNIVDIFNAISGNWTTASLSANRRYLTATGGKDIVLFGGGSNATGYSNRVDIFKPCASDAECDDGIFCNGREACQNGWCLSSSGNPCLSGPICNNGMCNETAKNCFVPEYTGCSDGYFCNGEEVCIQGTCIAIDIPCQSTHSCNNSCQEYSKTCFSPSGTSCLLTEQHCGVCNGNGTCTAEPGTNCQSVIVQNSTVIVQPATTNDIPVIVGSVVGGMAGLALIVLAVFYLQKKRNQSKPNTMELGAITSTIKDVIILEKLGSGAFGEVYRGLMNVR